MLQNKARWKKQTNEIDMQSDLFMHGSTWMHWILLPLVGWLFSLLLF
jgi:hypothetical protein